MPHCSCEKDCEKIVLVKRAPDQCFTLRKGTTGYTLQKGCRVYTATFESGPPQDSDIPLCFFRRPVSQPGPIFVAATRSDHIDFADFKDDEGTLLTLDDEECVLFLLKDFANVTVDLVKLDNNEEPEVILPFEIQKQVFFNAAQYDDAIEKEDASIALSSHNNCLC